MSPSPPNLRESLITVTDGVLGAAVLIFLGVSLGSFLDQKFNTAPWLSIIFSLAGGMVGLIRLVLKAISLDKK